MRITGAVWATVPLLSFYGGEADGDTGRNEELSPVDYGDDDTLIEGMIRAAVRQCMDILRTDSEDDLAAAQNGKIAVMFTAAYFYEHREEADHRALNLTLRALLFGNRKEGF